MSTIDDKCKDLVDSVDDALAASVVDLNSGLMLGVHHVVPSFTQTYLDAVAAAAVDMFRGKTVSNVEHLLTEQRGEDAHNAMEEIQMTTPKTYHFMTILPDKPNALMVLVTGKKANLGLGWASVRNALPEVAPLCP